MNGRLRRLRFLMPLSLAGCFHLPVDVCLTPSYDRPAGFSETYHAALSRQEPLLTTDGVMLAGGETIIGPPVLIWPGMPTDVEPPIEW